LRTGKFGKLTALQCAKTTKPMLNDGGGLYLQTKSRHSKSWLHRYNGRDGKEHWMGLGSYAEVSLAQAREASAEARKMLRAGLSTLSPRAGAYRPPRRPQK
jgi:hypothetical protein